jgi:hypothetical protein
MPAPGGPGFLPFFPRLLPKTDHQPSSYGDPVLAHRALSRGERNVSLGNAYALLTH